MNISVQIDSAGDVMIGADGSAGLCITKEDAQLLSAELRALDGDKPEGYFEHMIATAMEPGNTLFDVMTEMVNAFPRAHRGVEPPAPKQNTPTGDAIYYFAVQQLKSIEPAAQLDIIDEVIERLVQFQGAVYEVVRKQGQR